MSHTAPRADQEDLTPSQLVVLLASILVVALCGIAYELIIGTVSSYLLGNSVYQFSITIGLFMFAMGLGAYLSKLLVTELVTGFVLIEIAVSLVGGLCSLVLFLVFPYFSFYRPVMYTLIVVIGALVGLEIPILTRVLTLKQSLRFSIAHVLSLDYVGALIGSIAFPLVLLPHLGLFRSSFAIGLLNILVALFNVHVFQRTLRRPGLIAVLCGAVALALIACTVAATKIGSFAEGRLFADDIVFRHQSPYQRIVVTKSPVNGELRLYLDGHLQFCDRDEHRYHEALVHPVMSASGNRDRVLILGGGDGMAAREVLKYPDVKTIDLVDIDPVITDMSKDFPVIRRANQDSLRDPKVRIHHDDAFVFVRQSRDKFQRVIIDLPDPHNEGLCKLYSAEFYKMLSGCMDQGAMLTTQSSSPFYTREVFWSIAKTLQAAGFSTHSYHVAIPTFGIWGFTLAAKDGPAPNDFKITVPTRFLTRETMVAASIFGRDVGPTEVPVNTLFEPKLYQLYLKALER
ncbi:MAG: polyamine aminopropyltransferase [Thermodesulfobacteriota bacterium]